MDPLSQGVVGATLPQSMASSREIRIATLCGWIAGMLADLDILIRSHQDSLLSIQYHRHFTHSLSFIPVGGLIAALFLWPLLRKRLGFAKTYLYATLGYATAGLLDACTNYGTHLLWPFSDVRTSWNLISIIDPVFTFTILTLVIVGLVKKRPRYARIALVFALCYLSFSAFQKHRATAALKELAAGRNHEMTRLLVKPSFANLILWRGIYETNGMIHADGVHVGLGVPKIYPGESIAKFQLKRDLPDLVPSSTLYQDIKRFELFSDDYLAFYPPGSTMLGDMRYAYLPQKIQPLWGIKMDLQQPEAHVLFENYRQIKSRDWSRFWQMLRRNEL